MIKRLSPAILAAAVLLSGLAATKTDAAPAIGSEAPDFKLAGADGKEHGLADYKGKYVVLEWTNPGCPFVQKHYGSDNMQKLQAESTKKGVVWLSIDSSASGKEGYLTAEEGKAWLKKVDSHASELLMDTNGKVGQLYGAKTTPHMFLINPEGKLLYAGAIDSIPSADKDDIAKATNYVRTGLEEAMAGKTLGTATSKPYGCSVKY